MEFFIERYSNLVNFSPEQMNTLHDEFVEYQLLEEADIPLAVWKAAKENEGEDKEREEEEEDQERQ